jgi:branched-chain amino acid transport system permease protein
MVLLLMLPLYSADHDRDRTGALGSSRPAGYMFRVLDQAGIYILLALGLNIVVGYAGLLTWNVASRSGVPALWLTPAGLHALLAGLAGGALLAALRVLLGAPTLRLRGDYLAIVTPVRDIRILLNNLDVITNGPRGVINIDPATLDPAHLDPRSVATAKLLLYPKLPDLVHNLPLTLSSPVQYYYLILILCIGAVFFSYRLEGSRIGRAWAAIREDEDAAQTMGINKTTTKLLAFAMGAQHRRFSGVLFSGLQGFVSPESFILLESITILAMIVLGGMGSIPGSCWGDHPRSWCPGPA